MQGTRRVATTTLALLGLTVSACSSSTRASEAPASTAPHESTSPATSTGADTTQTVRDSVLPFVSTYVRTLDDLRADPSQPLDEIYQVAVAPEATAEASVIGRLRSQGYRQTGRSQLVTAALVEAASTAPAAGGSSPSLSSVIVKVCLDVGQVDAVDQEGKSVLPPGRPRYLIEQLTVVNSRYPNAASWRVSQAPNSQAQSCGG